MSTSIVMAQADGVRYHVPWAGKLLAFGARLARAQLRPGVQLVTVVTVPARDYAALLIGAGWILTRPVLFPTSVADTAKALKSGDSVRAVIRGNLVTGRFHRLHMSAGIQCVQIGPSSWPLSYIQHLALDDELTEARYGKIAIPPMGSLVSRSGLASRWAENFSSSSLSLSFIGIASRLCSDLDVSIGWADAEDQLDRLADILRLDDGYSSPCRASEVVSGSADVVEEVDPRTHLAILDGNTGVRWLESLLCPLVVCVIDRSTERSELEDTILSSRAAGSIFNPKDIGWPGAEGIEVMAYEVQL